MFVNELDLDIPPYISYPVRPNVSNKAVKNLDLLRVFLPFELVITNIPTHYILIILLNRGFV